MNKSENFKRPYIFLLPIFGMVLFIILYIIATIIYSGESLFYLNQHGFSFWNHYLCDLLDYNTINGEINMARFIARLALVTLCISLMLLWFHLPKLFLNSGTNVSIMRFFGILALFLILFLASGTHDIIIRIAGLFGVIAFISSFIELIKNLYFRLFLLGLFCLIIFLVNYYIYETGFYIKELPVIQKITFFSFIVWFVFLDLTLYRKIKLLNEKKISSCVVKPI